MKIVHIAIWVSKLEVMKAFYEEFFQAKSGKIYCNSKKNFSSYFLNFDEGVRLELMHNPKFLEPTIITEERLGITHLAMSVGSVEKVNELTEKLRSHGFPILGEPRTTGDGYYESVIADPEGNRIEITV